jgi:hypothetical protein
MPFASAGWFHWLGKDQRQRQCLLAIADVAPVSPKTQ